jgi:hypothetical protein
MSEVSVVFLYTVESATRSNQVEELISSGVGCLPAPHCFPSLSLVELCQKNRSSSLPLTINKCHSANKVLKSSNSQFVDIQYNRKKYAIFENILKFPFASDYLSSANLNV